jgi:hypothetical protein
MAESRIIFYEGYKQKEIPRIFIRDNEQYEVQIKRRKRRLDKSTGMIMDQFICRAGPYLFQVTVFPDGTYEIDESNSD